MPDPRNTDFLRQHARVAQRVSNIETGVHPVKADVPYEDVGEPVDAGGGDVDLHNYIHYGTNNPGDSAEVVGGDRVDIDGGLSATAGPGTSLNVEAGTGVTIGNATSIVGGICTITVTSAIGLSANLITIDGTAGGVVFEGNLIFMANLPPGPVEGAPGALYRDATGFVRVSP